VFTSGIGPPGAVPEEAPSRLDPVVGRLGHYCTGSRTAVLVPAFQSSAAWRAAARC
jgi:hypothetical protein